MDNARRFKSDNHRKRVIACAKIHEKARYIRGRFLNSVAAIEHDVALLLTEYFCTDDEEKRKLFFSNVAMAMSLNTKRDILVEIVKKDYPRYWDENGQFLKDMQKIQEFRNRLAHSLVDVSEEALSRPLEDGIGFVQWKKGEPITDQEFEDWEVRTNMISSTLNDIKMLLPFKERSKKRE
jgi:hypothetical protein